MSSQAPRPSIASFWHDLPREGRLLLSVVAFEFIGTGLVLPFWVVYLHELRGYSLGVVGLLLAWMSAAGVLAAAPAGKLIDRLGPRAVMLGVLASAMAGQTLVAFADNIVTTTLAIAIIGAGFGMGWPTSQALISSVVPSAIRARYFGMNFSLLNLGIGIGGIVGGLVANVDHLWSFQLMYLGDAVSHLPSLFLVLVPLRHIGGPEPVPEDGPTDEVTYLQVFRAPAMRTVCALFFVSAFVGYSQLNAGLPAYARGIGEVSTRALGLAFAANTLVIVVLQLVVLQRIEGRRRTRVIAGMGVVWAFSWLLLGASGLVPGTLGATLLVTACASVFAFGETLLQPTIPALVNDLAPDHLRGRYNALSSLMFSLAFAGGPVVASFLVGRDLGWVYIGVLVGGCVLLAVMALRVERRIPPHVNGVREPEPLVAATTSTGTPPDRISG